MLAFCAKETITSPVGCSGGKSALFTFPLLFFPGLSIKCCIDTSKRRSSVIQSEPLKFQAPREKQPCLFLGSGEIQVAAGVTFPQTPRTLQQQDGEEEGREEGHEPGSSGGSRWPAVQTRVKNSGRAISDWECCAPHLRCSRRRLK